MAKFFAVIRRYYVNGKQYFSVASHYEKAMPDNCVLYNADYDQFVDWFFTLSAAESFYNELLSRS